MSKFPNLFDVYNQSFSDETLMQSAWKKVSNAVDLPVDKCVAHWNSLKRSAKYHANESKIPGKSGTSAGEMTTETYRSEWAFRDVMGFYTPPSLRNSTETIVLSNTRQKPSATTTSKALKLEIADDSFDSLLCDYDGNGDPCYVSIWYFCLHLMIVKYTMIYAIVSIRAGHQLQHQNQNRKKIKWLKVYRIWLIRFHRTCIPKQFHRQNNPNHRRCQSWSSLKCGAISIDWFPNWTKMPWTIWTLISRTWLLRPSRRNVKLNDFH